MPGRKKQVTQLEPVTPEELAFVKTVADVGTIKAAAKQMWPNLRQSERKGQEWLKIPRVQAAYRAELMTRASEDPQQIRIMFEQCGFGLQDRIRIAAELAQDTATSKNVKVQLLQYADELEQRRKKSRDDQPVKGLLEAIVLGGTLAKRKREIEAPPEVQDAVVEESECLSARN